MKLPHLIIAGVAVGVGVYYWRSRATSPVDGGSATTPAGDGATKPTPGSVLDGAIGAIKGVGAAFENLRDLVAGGKPGGTGAADETNEKDAKRGVSPAYQAGRGRDPTLTRENTRRPRGSTMPRWSTLWADNAVVGNYS